MKYILTIIYIIFTTLGLFLLKIGGNSLALTIKPYLEVKIGYITLLGFLCCICSFILWQKLLVTYNLTYIVPITTGIVQIIIMIVGILFFKEKINLIGILGTIVVIIGILMITMSKK